MKTLPIQSFVKDLLEEAITATPPIDPQKDIIQSMDQRSEVKAPENWYKYLQLDKLEQQFKLPHNTLLHIINRESTGDPNQVSKKGARGLFGITPASGYTGDPLNHHKAALFTANMLKNLITHYTKLGFDTHSDVMEKAIAAYNWGMGNLSKNKYNTEYTVNPEIITLPKETKNYIAYMKAHNIIKPPRFKKQPIPNWYKVWNDIKTATGKNIV